MAGRLRSIAKIVIVDVAAPLIAYSLLRSAGMSTVTALVLSGVFPHWAWPSAPSSTAVSTPSVPWS
jgi:hypothetical protein